MKYILFPLTLFLFACFVEHKAKYELPLTWPKNFSIKVYEGGGMNNESNNISFSKNSCQYILMKEGVKNSKNFKLSDKQLNEVLAKLISFNVDKIQSQKSDEIIHDKETKSICFYTGLNQDRCIETGATMLILPKHSINFNNSFNYLLALAEEKSK